MTHITRNSKDPTNQARNRNKGTRRLTDRLNRIEREVKALFRSVPRKRRSQTRIVNQAEIITVYDYPLSGQELTDLQNSIRFITNRQLLESQLDIMPSEWYWQENVELPYRQGTTQEIVRFNQLISKAKISGVKIRGLPPETLAIESVLLSERYRQALNNVFVSNFSVIKNLSQTTSAQVIQQINLGIQAGNTPTDIGKAITERFDVSRSSAQRIARTEVNKAYNDAKINATNIGAERSGLRAAVIPISALIPSTRETHAARHGNAYTTADQQQWWNRDSNRINCLCTIESVLINRKGKVVQSEFQTEIKEERKLFDPQPKPKPKPRPIAKPKKTPKIIDEIKTSKPTELIQKLKRSKKPTVVEDQKIDKRDKAPELSKIKLTGDESAYIEYYKGDGFYKQNEILRNPDAFSSSEVASAGQMRDSINSAVKKSAFKTNGTLYRGIKSQDIFDIAEKLIGKNIPISTPQSTASNAGSATGWSGLIRTKKGNFLSAEKGKSVVFKIRTKKGQHGLDLESLSIGNTGEREVLLGSGGNYKVTGVRSLTDDAGNVTAKIIEVDYNE